MTDETPTKFLPAAPENSASPDQATVNPLAVQPDAEVATLQAATPPHPDAAPSTTPDPDDTRPRPLSPHEQLADILDELGRRMRKADSQGVMDELDCTSGELTGLLHQWLPDYSDALAKLLSYSSALGVLLSKLMTAYPTLVKKRVVTGNTTWTIFPGGWSNFSWVRWEMQAPE